MAKVQSEIREPFYKIQWGRLVRLVRLEKISKYLKDQQIMKKI